MKVSEMNQKHVQRVVDILMATGMENGVFLAIGPTPFMRARMMGYQHGRWIVCESKSKRELAMTEDLGIALDWLLGVLPKEE